MDNHAINNKERTAPFCLEGWLVQPQSNELTCLNSEETRSLEPRLMRLLCLLAAAPQRVFSREELMAWLWPHVIVNENSLTRAVSELRKRLVSNDRHASPIETIPKTGYRLAANCRVRDYVEPATAQESATISTAVSPLLTTGGPRNSFTFVPGMAAVASLVLSLAMVLMSTLQGGLPQDTAASQQGEEKIALADVNLSSQAAIDALITARLETVSAKDYLGGNGIVASELGATQPVMSRDGDLFAYIRNDEQGSSLVLGSTRLPSSPVTILTTQDTLYNLQWSPVDRALLFAQTPRLAPAALLSKDDQASLVLFDLESFTMRVIDGPAVESGDSVESEALRSFKLTALGRSFDWLS